MTESEEHVAAFARAFDLDPRTVRSDTPLSSVGWRGTPTDWLLVADHLRLSLTTDPRISTEPRTIGDVLAIVHASASTR